MATFTISFSGPTDEILTKARYAVMRSGGSFSGNASSGDFEGNGVEGEYEVDGKEITITINKKPFFASWARIESAIQGFFR